MLDTMTSILAMTLFFGSGILLTRWTTGWDKIEAKYKCRKDDCAQQISRGSYRWVRATFRFGDLGVAVELYPKVLWLRAGAPLNLGLKTLCIPWSAVEKAQMKNFLFFQRIHLQIRDCPFTVKISGEAGMKIYEMVNSFKSSA